MYIQADVSLVCWLRFAGMHTYAHTHYRLVRPGRSEESTLRMNRRRNRVGSTLEDHEEGIALRIDLDAICLLKSGAQQAAALPQYTGVAIAELVQQAGGAFDVCEE